MDSLKHWQEIRLYLSTDKVLHVGRVRIAVQIGKNKNYEILSKDKPVEWQCH